MLSVYFPLSNTVILKLSILFIQIQVQMEILKKLTENNFNEVAKLIQSNSLPEQLMTGNIKSQIKRYRHSYTTPASLDLARKHKRTAKFGFRPSLRGHEDQLCPCCNLRVYNEDIPLCENVEIDQKKKKQIVNSAYEYKLTSDVALFLTFIKSTILLTLMNSILHSIFNFLTSMLFGKQCQSLKDCPKTWWNALSMSNKFGQQNWILIVDILNLVAIVFSILYFLYNRRRQYRLSADIDSELQTQADFTLLISNIPILQFPKKGQTGRKGQKLQFFYRKHLEEYFNSIISKWLSQKEEWQRNKDLIGLQVLNLMNKNNGQLRSEEIIKTLSLCYNMSRLEVLQDIKTNLVDSFQNNQDEGTSLMLNQQGESLYSERFASIPERVNFLNDCELILNGQYARDNSFLFSVTHFVGHAFVSFQFGYYKEYIQRLFSQNPLVFNYNGNYLRVEDASHPTGIYWENIKVSQTYRRNRIFSSYLILIAILVFSFTVLLCLQLLKENNSKSQEGGFINIFKSYSLNLLIVIVIIAFNYGFDYLAIILTQSQKRKTRTQFVVSVLFKSFAAKLINTIMLYFFISLIFRHHYEDTRFMGPIGLVLQITTLIVLSGVLHLIKSLIYPYQLYLRFLRWWRYRRNPNSVQYKFQKTLNKQFEYPQFDFAEKYSYYLVTLYTVFFYSYLVPIGIPVMFFICLLQYWADKITLFRRSSLKYQYGFRLWYQVSKLFESSIFALGLGNLIFSTYMHNETVTVINLVGFGIALLFTLIVWLAPRKLEDIIFGKYELNQKYIYDDCLHDGKFDSTYWTQNPATFLIEEERVTGKKKVANPALNRKSIEGGMLLSAFQN